MANKAEASFFMPNKALLKFFLALLLLCSGARCDVTFNFINNCQYSVWRASSPGIGDADPELGPYVQSIFSMDDPWSGSIWVRTKCSSNASNYFSCETGDCGSGIVDCSGPKPSNPVTLLNFNINQNVVSYELSLVHGQNHQIRINPSGGTLVDGSGPCPMVQCDHDLGYEGACPLSLLAFNYLGAAVGCYSACDKWKDPKYCCDGNGCQIDEYTQKFKGLCPTARAYPDDKNPPVYQCKDADSYEIILCPT